MTENKVLNWIGWILIALGMVIIIFRRIAGVDLTEGQLFMQDISWWVTAVGCLIGGYAIIKNAEGR